MKTIHYLDITWATSRGADTYGYNICRLDDDITRRRFRCIGGGYDMIGTVFAQWLQATFPEKLAQLAHRAHGVYIIGMDGKYDRQPENKNPDSLYGITAEYVAVWAPQNLKRVTLDGACGMSSMQRIAEACGLEVQWHGNKKGQTRGYFVQEKAEG